MKTSEFMDKQIMELSRSNNNNCKKDSFTFFTPDDDDSDDEFLRNCNSMDRLDSVRDTSEVRMTLVSEINQTIKEHFENLLHSVDNLSARLSLLEGKIRHLENDVDNLKVSAEYNINRTDGKLRQLETIRREVQDGVHFLRDKQEIAETQLQLAKLQGSKSNTQSGDHKTAVQVQASSPISEQSPQPQPISGALSVSLPTFLSDAPSTILYQNAAPVHSQILQNPIPSCPQPPSYYLPAEKTLETTYQYYNVTPTQQSQPPPALALQLNNPAPNLPQVLESTQQPQLHSPFGAVKFRNQPPWTHHPEETPPIPSHNYQPSILQSSSLPPRGPPIDQFYMDSSHQMQGQPSTRRDFSNMYPSNGSSSHYSDSSLIPSQYTPSSSVPGGGSNYNQLLPKAQILPHALPTASSMDTGSSPGGSGNKVPFDDVVDKVTAMGFRRDLVRANVRKLTENGQSVDLNVVLDKLMNNNGNVQPQKDWFGR